VQLKDGEFANHIALLELFCYGTWSDYKGICFINLMQAVAGMHNLTPLSCPFLL
jgi:hypothetical protein